MRRPVIRLWRKFERLKRATITKAVLVVRNDRGAVLLLPSSSEALRLPAEELHASEPIATQVEDWLHRLLHRCPPPSLVAIDGTPGRGITFLYAATGEVNAGSGDQLWLDLEVAASSLGDDSRLLRLCLDRQKGPGR
jgi:hypothetical protein